MRYVMGTASQANAFNQDLNGVNGGVNSSLTWAELGAITLPIDDRQHLESSGAIIVAEHPGDREEVRVLPGEEDGK